MRSEYNTICRPVGEIAIYKGSSATLKEWKRRGPIDLNLITRIITKKYGLTIEALLGKSRAGKLPEARHLCWYFALQLTSHTQYDLEVYYKRDRTAAVHARRKIRGWIRVDPEFREHVYKIEELITGSV